MQTHEEISSGILTFLEQEGVNPEILNLTREYRKAHPMASPERVPVPRYA